MSDAALSVVYQLKVSLRGISPMIWRRLLVPADLTLYGLHRVVQIAFGWEDYHLHAFKLHGRRYGTMWTGERHRDAAGREVMLADLQLRVRQRIHYEYDSAICGSTRSGSRPSSSARAARSTRSASSARVPAHPKISAVRPTAGAEPVSPKPPCASRAGPLFPTIDDFSAWPHHAGMSDHVVPQQKRPALSEKRSFGDELRRVANQRSMPSATAILLRRAALRVTPAPTFEADVTVAIDRFAAEHDISREQAIDIALRDWALGRGYLALKSEEGMRPEELNAANDD